MKLDGRAPKPVCQVHTDPPLEAASPDTGKRRIERRNCSTFWPGGAFTFSSRIVPEVGKIQQQFTKCLGNGRGNRRGAPSPFPVERALGIRQMWSK